MLASLASINIKLSNIVGEDRLEYCVHFESRTPDYDPSELQDLINFINGLELNELDRDLHLEDQSGWVTSMLVTDVGDQMSW